MSISTKYILWQKLQNNELPLWTNKINGGFPLLGEGQIGTLFLPNLIIYRLFNFTTAYNLSLVFSVVLISIGMYLWLRLLHFQIITSFYGGILLAFSGIVMTHLTHITLLQGLSVLPWVMLATHLLIINRSIVNICIFTLFVSQQIFAGFPQAVFISLIFAFSYYIWMNKIFKINKRNLFILSYFLIGLLLATLLSAAQLFSAWEFLQNSTDPKGFSLQIASYFSYPFKHLITFLDPFLLGNPKFGTYPSFMNFNGSIFWENTGYIGLIPLLLIIYLLVNFIKNKMLIKNFKVKSITEVKHNISKSFSNKFSIRFGTTTTSEINIIKFLLAILAASFLFMTGSNSPLYIIYDIWPFNLFRVPSRFIWIFTVVLLIMAVYGFELLLRRIQKPLSKYLLAFIIVGISLCQLINTWNNYNIYSPASLWLSRPPILDKLENTQRIKTFGTELLHNQTFLKKGWNKIKPYLFLKNSLYPNSNVLWNISQIDGSVGRFLRRPQVIDELIKSQIMLTDKDATISAVFKKLLSLNNVDTLILPVKITNNKEFYETTNVSEEDKSLYVYGNKQAVPRSYLTSKTVITDTFEQGISLIAGNGFKAGENVLLEEQLNISSLSPSHQGKVEVISDNDMSVKLKVQDNLSTAILILADNYYPGWQATINGKPTKIYPANIRQRAVVVPAGDQIVEFMYRPQSFYYGASVSGITLLSIISILVISLLRKPSRFFKSRFIA